MSRTAEPGAPVRGRAGRRAVLVTGAHRSGTSVLGELLCHAAGTAEVWEPLNPDWGLTAVTVPYPDLPAGSRRPEVAALGRYLDTGLGTWRAKPGARAHVPPAAHNALRTARMAWRWQTRLRRAPVTVVKDPFLLLGLGVFAERAGGPAVVAVKHPCAWAQSLVRVGWPAHRQATALMDQPVVREVAREVLPARLHGVRDWGTLAPLEVAAVTWALLYGMVEHQLLQGAPAHVVAMEWFADRPVPVLQGMYRATGLSEPADLQALAERYTGGATVHPGAQVIHQRQRDSRRLAGAWREEVPAADQAAVRAIAGGVYQRFYADWEEPMAGPPA